MSKSRPPLRMEVTVSSDDPLHGVLSGLEPGSRSKIVRAILAAALVPGGWARITDSGVSSVSATRKETVPAPNTQAKAQTVSLLRQFGALDDD